MTHRTTLLLAGSLLAAGGVLAGFTSVEWAGHTGSEMTAELTAELAAAERAFTLDASHSHVVFSTRHLGTGNAYGMFHEPTGTLNYDADTNRLSDVRVTIDANNVDTGNADRDVHLRGGDFFSVEEFPSITFRQLTPVQLTDGKATLRGELTMIGSTVEVDAEVEYIGAGVNPFARRDIVGFEATFTVRRSEFDMNYGIERGVLDDEVRLIVAIEAIAND